jgi:nucleotide-binding universal stress UspA family protein
MGNTGRIDWPEHLKGEAMISKILLPTDGSKTAQKAARYAVDLAKNVKASVIVLSVIDKGAMISQTVPARKTARHIIEPVEDYFKEAAEGFAGTLIKICKEKRVKSDTVIVKGHPVEEILKTAKRVKADLIIMGSHGRSALAAAILGSVTYGVVHKESKIPVLIVRR